MRAYYLHRKLTTEERTNEAKTCNKCHRPTTIGFRCYVGYPSDPYDDHGYPSEELGFSVSDDQGACSPEMVVLCAMIDEILEVMKHSASNLDYTLAKYVLAQYEAEVRKTKEALKEDITT